jgi:iron-sulfur cluster repair protein YtfE (RIC family)
MPLSREHHDGLIAAQLLKKGAADYKGMPTDFKGKSEYIVQFYYSHLIPHFQNEEDKLFPQVKGIDKNIDSLIIEIIQEHNLIKNYIKAVEENNHTEETLDQLGKLLDDHIRKEERVLFELIQNKCSESELEKIESILSE